MIYLVVVDRLRLCYTSFVKKIGAKEIPHKGHVRSVAAVLDDPINLPKGDALIFALAMIENAGGDQEIPTSSASLAPVIGKPQRLYAQAPRSITAAFADIFFHQALLNHKDNWPQAWVTPVEHIVLCKLEKVVWKK